MRLASIDTRLRQICRFGRSALSLRDLPAACVLGFARGSPFNGSNATTSLGQRFFPLMDVRPKQLRGARVWIDTSDLGQLISYEEIMVEGCYDLELVPFSPSVVLDCGAHIGLFTLLAAARYPKARVRAFEPNPHNFRMLEKHCERLETRVELFPAAVSVEGGYSWFQAEDSNTGRLVATEGHGGVLVKVMALGPIVDAAKGGPLVLKLDVEGEERGIVPALTPRLPPECAVFFETHDGAEGWRTVTQALAGAGFTIQCLRQRGAFQDGFALRV